ncbi:MAG: hypothetical protein FWF78_00215 [Defluviitaleaceae bacterium]|nr:hypothetical protein [Defluviitaleaceae bacterium]
MELNNEIALDEQRPSKLDSLELLDINDGLLQAEMRKVRCPRCKEFYELDTVMPIEYCPTCTNQREAQVQHIRDLIRDNKGINAMDLASKTGIPITFIMNVMRDGEIEIRKNNPL